MEMVAFIDRGLKRQAPLAISVVLALIAALPFGARLPGLVAHALPLIAIYVWATERPDLLPRLAVFAVGLLQDLLTGLPPGLTALTFLVVRVVSGERTPGMSRSLPGQWAGYVLVAAVSGAAGWLIESAWQGDFAATGGALQEALLGAALYPLCAFPLTALARALPGRT